MSRTSPLNAPRLLFALALTTLAASSQATTGKVHEQTWCADRCDQVVIDWNQQTHQVIKAASGYADPMAASRILPMVHLAMHDAVNAARPRYRAYAYQPQALASKAGADATVATAGLQLGEQIGQQAIQNLLVPMSPAS